MGFHWAIQFINRVILEYATNNPEYVIKIKVKISESNAIKEYWGKSIMRIIDELKNHNPGIDVIIAANIIQNEAVELFKDYLVFATRLSKNSFVGVNQSKLAKQDRILQIDFLI